MSGAMPPLHQYAFVAWCLVKLKYFSYPITVKSGRDEIHETHSRIQFTRQQKKWRYFRKTEIRPTAKI